MEFAYHTSFLLLGILLAIGFGVFGLWYHHTVGFTYPFAMAFLFSTVSMTFFMFLPFYLVIIIAFFTSAYITHRRKNRFRPKRRKS